MVTKKEEKKRAEEDELHPQSKRRGGV